MASDRTFVTELATGLGMIGDSCDLSLVSERPAQLVNLDEDQWRHLKELRNCATYDSDFAAGLSNGRAFLHSPEALNGRVPRIVEWTGGRRPPGDEVVPSDLRIDHVYLVSCKYLSRILHNPSPARLVDNLLAQSPAPAARDWYERVAPAQFQRLYQACVEASGMRSLPAKAGALTREQRRELAVALGDGWPAGAEPLYSDLCSIVSRETARLWRERLHERTVEAMLWRLLRIGSAPYFILGTSNVGSMRLRIDSPWDWRQSFRLKRFDVEPQLGGQPRVHWWATYEVRVTGSEREVHGHVEIRWSHGRFAQPPEAKVYLDSAHENVPGYHVLEESGPEVPDPVAQQGELWATLHN